MPIRKIRILIVEDSRLYQRFLCKILEEESCFEIAGVAGTGAQAIQMADALKPDVITLDLNLPDVNEFELLEYFLKHTQIPVIVVSSLPQSCEKAIRLGARDFMEKITETAQFSAEHFAILLQMKIKMQARYFPRPAPRSTKPLKASPRSFHRQLIVLGASIGGTESTLEILRELPANMPGILIVQHMPAGFTKAYAARLNQNCRLNVSEAKNGDPILPGRVLVAESGRHMRVVQTADGYFVRCKGGDSVNGFCPSVDVLFSSVADTDAGGTAIILTGMGHDGVSGIKKLHEKGFYTLGQNKESCAVFGMPQAASRAHALDELLSPSEIAERLMKRYTN